MSNVTQELNPTTAKLPPPKRSDLCPSCERPGFKVSNLGARPVYNCGKCRKTFGFV